MANKRLTPPRDLYQAWQPSIISDWSPDTAQAAIIRMQQGYFYQAAALLDAMMSDDRISTVVNTRANGLLATPLLFEPANEADNKALDVRDALAEDYYAMANEAALDLLLFYGRGLGVGLAELRWTSPTKTSRAIPTLHAWHPSHLRYETLSNTWYVRTRESGEIALDLNSGKWLLYTPFGNDFTSARSFVRGLAVPFLAKRFALQDWVRHSEKLSGMLVGRTPEAARADDPVYQDMVNTFAQELNNMGSDGVIVVPEGYDVDLLESSGNSEASFRELIQWADTAISIAVLGQNLSTEVSSGSLAAARVQERVRLDYAQGDAETLSTALHDYLIKPWASANYGDVSLAPWVTYNIRANEDITDIADAVKTYADSMGQLTAMGVPVDIEFVLQRLGLPMLEGERLKAWEKTRSSITPPTATEATSRRVAKERLELSRIAQMTAQGYIDSAVDTYTHPNNSGTTGMLETVLEALDGATDYETLRRRIRALMLSDDVSSLEDMEQATYQALLIANLTGRFSEPKADE